jgi:hypothetical protein
MHPKQTRVASKEAVNHAARTNDRRWLNFTPAFADSMIGKHASNTTVNRQNRGNLFPSNWKAIAHCSDTLFHLSVCVQTT